MNGFRTMPVTRVKDQTVERFKKIESANVWAACESLGINSYTSAVKPIAPGMTLCGRAITMRLVPVQDTKAWNKFGAKDYEHSVHTLSRLGEPGDIHVIDMGGYMAASLFGGHASTDAKVVAKAGGVVIDGVNRDSEEIISNQFPCFSRGTVSPHAHGSFRTANLNNEAVQIGSISVSPGDVVVGDHDGINVVPADRAEEIIVIAERIATGDDAAFDLWHKGEVKPGAHLDDSLLQIDPSLIRNLPKGVVDTRKK
jgi:regulator of RNase E activity RraA